MTSRKTLAICAILGVIVVAAAGLQGTARFTGLRWVFDWELPQKTMQPHPNPAAPQATGLPRPYEAGGNIDLSKIVFWIVIGIVVVLAVILLWRWLSRRTPHSAAAMTDIDALSAPGEVEPETVPEQEPEASALRRGVEQALLLLDAEREPADAVMTAWLGLQQTAEESGILRRSAETATEFTSRIMSHVSADDRAIRNLLALYLRTRFGDHPITRADVARARESLEALARSWDDGTRAHGMQAPGT